VFWGRKHLIAGQRQQTAAATAVPSLVSLPRGTQHAPSMLLQVCSREQCCSSSPTHHHSTRTLQQQPGCSLLASLRFLVLALSWHELLTPGSGFVLVDGNMVSSMLLYGLTKMGCASNRQYCTSKSLGGETSGRLRLLYFQNKVDL